MLRVEKEFSLQGESGVGQSINFSITVKNEGNVDLVNAVLTDTMFENSEGQNHEDFTTLGSRTATMYHAPEN